MQCSTSPAPSASAPAACAVQRVVFLNRYFYPDRSATSQILTDLASGLAAREFDVHVICSRQLYDDPKQRLSAGGRYQGVSIHRIATTRFGRGRLLGRALDYLSFYVSASIALLRVIRRGDLVIAKTDPPLLSLIAAPLTRLRLAVLINWQQDVFPEVATQLGANPLPRWLDRSLRRLRDDSMRAARLNIVVGTRMREFFAARGIPAAQLRVIENWADCHAIVRKDPSESALRRRLGFNREFVVCYSGNFGRAHDYGAILGAIELLRTDPSIAFLFIGGGVKMEALAAHAAAERLRQASFLPYQPREALGDSLAAADVHLASLNPALEGLIVPSKFYGILAAGRPVIFIGDPEGELARIIREEGCGLTVAAGDAAALAEAIRQLRAAPQRCGAMGAAARQLSQRYSVQSGIGRWLELLGALGPAAPTRDIPSDPASVPGQP